MILLALLLYVGAEIAVFVVVAQHIGLLLSVILVVAVSASGPLLVRRAGLGVLEHARGRLAQGESPTPDLLDGVVLLLGGALVCIPGFIGDVVGLILLFGPVRHLLIRRAGRKIARRLQGAAPGRGGRRRGGRPVIEADSQELRPGADRGSEDWPVPGISRPPDEGPPPGG